MHCAGYKTCLRQETTDLQFITSALMAFPYASSNVRTPWDHIQGAA